MIIIENEIIKAAIHPKGAELVSLFHKANELEYMWSADPAFWGKTSPVLFPIIGSVKDDIFVYEGKKYTLPRHGFAREKMFEVEKQTNDSVTFLLKCDNASLVVYPFWFELRLHYSLKGNQLKVSYEVKNKDEKTMYFSIGGHPAFQVPLVEGTSYEDYYLEFDETEDLNRWPLSEEGLVKTAAESLLPDTNHLPLTKELFYQDALVFKHLKSSKVTLKSDKTEHQLAFSYEGFPFLGIWAAKGADFVCIEPWCGIADAVDHNQELTEKEGINALDAGDTFTRAWFVEIS